MNIRILNFAFGCLLGIVGGLFPSFGAAQDGKLKVPAFSALAGRATDSVTISLNPWLLHVAGALIEDKDEDSVATKRLLSGIQSIEVRSYKFASDDAYSPDDIEGFRTQLQSPGWSRLMQAHDREKGEDVEMYILIEDNVSKGFALISSGPREFTVVNIAGRIKVDDLPKLQSRLHLPKIAELDKYWSM